MTAAGYLQTFKDVVQSVRFAPKTGHWDWDVRFHQDCDHLGSECGRSQTCS